MIEKTPREINLKVLSRERVTTELGIVERSEIVYKDAPRTIYTIAGLTESGIEYFAKEIVTAERKAANPNFIKKLKSVGTTPEQVIEKGSLQFIEDVKNDTPTPEIYKDPLIPLIMQKALERVVNEAKKVPQPQQ